jgi:arabinan endo-1,5-alpha-L-arabinosidase
MGEIEPTGTRRHSRSHRWLIALATTALVATTTAVPAGVAAADATYRNPLQPAIPGNGIVESCADPTVIQSQIPGDPAWYMYCTTDPLNDADRNADGDFVFHKIPMLRSLDLVEWTYMGDAFAANPSWAEPTAGLWAPEIQYFNGQYYLYYGVTDVRDSVSGEADCPFDNAIGVATSPGPLGPWTDSGGPVVEPRRGGGGCNFFWTFDPDVLLAPGGQKYIYYGSYYGGVQARVLSPDGLAAPEASAVQITIPNRYEGSEVVHRDGFYWYFGSATNCCNGPLTGYSVFAGRSTSPTGPFVDRDGVSLLAGRVGGIPVISMNGNRWVGPGHQTSFVDHDGQWWMIYHAIDRDDPYFEGAVGFTKRPVLLDPLDWRDGWPTVRGGYWASDTTVPAPAAQPGEATAYAPSFKPDDQPKNLLPDYSDEFDDASLSPAWSWVRPPAAGTYGEEGGSFRLDAQKADLFVDSNNASVLVRPAPGDSWMLETKVRLDLPAEGCCHNYTQAGVVVYANDDEYLKLVHVSIWETRQTEFAKEVASVPAGYPRYGNTVVSAPGEWTWLRIVRRVEGRQEQYTAYTSRDGSAWSRGGTWTHRLREEVRIGLVSMGEPPDQEWRAWFDYVRVYRLER